MIIQYTRSRKKNYLSPIAAHQLVFNYCVNNIFNFVNLIVKEFLMF